MQKLQQLEKDNQNKKRNNGKILKSNKKKKIKLCKLKG